MINEDVMKAVIHVDDAFRALLEKHGALEVKAKLQDMQMKLTTQIAQWGDERKDWFKRANSLLVVVRNRMDETKDYEQSQLAEYKELVQGILENVQDKFDKHDYPLPDVNDLDAVDAWLESVGL